MLVQIARAYAEAAHTAIGQKRKYTNEPYIYHPEAVVEILQGIKAPDFVLAAAWLHDVVEDTQVTMDDLRRQFPADVCETVYWVTDISKPEDGNRAVRKEIDRQHYGRGTYWSKTLKLADIIDNSKDIVPHDENFAKVWMREKQLLLDVLTDSDPRLFAQAQQQIMDYFLGRRA